MRRSLSYYGRTNLAVILGAAVTTAVLTGALVVGDSLRGSLRDLTLDRLGSIEWALVGERPFRQSLAEDLATVGHSPVPALSLRASVTEPESGSRASRISLWGVDDRFFDLYPERPPVDLAAGSGPFPAAAINRSLADELGVAVASELVLAFQRPSDVPRETVVGRADSAETVELLRVRVGAILPDRGPGGFGLEPRQTRALNVFVDISRLQRRLLGRGSDAVNVLLSDEPAAVEALDSRLSDSLTLDDLGLLLRPWGEAVNLQSRQFVIDDVRARTILGLADDDAISAQPVLTYLANEISIGARTLPYSTISALEPPEGAGLGAFRLASGGPAPPLGDDGIYLNRWAADDLEASVGDTVEIAYYVLGARDELATERRSLRLEGIVAMEGLALDPHLTPEFPGIEGAEDISAWDPPFPVDLDSIRPRDEEYWDLYRSAPKAFVSQALGETLWRSRFGSLTSIRLAGSSEPAIDQLTRTLEESLGPESAGLVLRPLRDEGLRAASGATDFAGLFLGLSFFLIIAAALLTGLLFRLGVERRAPELGLLLATGFTTRQVRRRFLREGVVLAVCGALLGLAGGAGYAATLIAGLRTWWLPAIGEPVLELHIVPATLALGGGISILVVVSAVAISLRRLGKIGIVALLAGAVAGGGGQGPSRLARWLAAGSLLLAGALTFVAFGLEARAAAGLAFGVGAALLVGGISLFAHLSGRPLTSANSLGRGNAATLAARNSARSRSRSLLSVSLMACATFVIVIVAANRVHREVDISDPASGTGGFSLVAETDVPIYGDLAGESPTVAEALAGATAIPLRLLPGEDVSCLNLYQPERPRILGAPSEMVRRGGFTFQQAIEERSNPWELLEEPLEEGVVPAIGDYNSVLWILHSGLGKDLIIENERGEPVRLRLVGLLAKSLFQSELVISEAAFQQHFPSRAGYSYFLLDPPPVEAGGVATALERELARVGFDAVSTGDRLAAFQAVEDTYLTTFQTLGGLGLILGTLGMGIILLRNVLERRAELATLRAIGYRQASLRNQVLLENAFLLSIGLAIGTLAGAAATAPHLTAVGGDVAWGALGGTLAAVFVLGMTSSILAVRSVAQMPLLPSLRAR